MVSVKAKKHIIQVFTQQGKAGVSSMCKALDLNRSSFYTTSQRSIQSIELEKSILIKSDDNPRYGYRRITALIRRDGEEVNAKRVQAVRRKHGLQVRKKQRRTRRVNENEVKRLRATKPNEVWSWDFVHDQTAHGGSFRMLSVLDEHTRQCHGLEPRHSYRAKDVIHKLDQLIEIHGAPKYIRSDNGPEFIAYAIKDWMKARGIKTHYIKPGSPWEQPFVESFHDKLRDEFLNRELFYSLREARVMVEDWRKYYNAERIHSAINYKTPNEFAFCELTSLRATPSTTSTRRNTLLISNNRRTINLSEITV